MIKVLITEDSRTVGEFIKIILNSDSEIHVVGWAKNGQECIEQAKVLKPDVITMDIHMPVMDGLQATKYIMENMPTSILVVSSLVKTDLNISFNALKTGALDIIEKPRMKEGISVDKIGEELVQRVKIVARIHPFKRLNNHQDVNTGKRKERQIFISANKDRDREGILIVGASTGGPPVLNHVLKKIPPEFSLPIIITQHISSGFLDGLIEWLQKDCCLKIKKGKNYEDIRKGMVYFAPDNYHLGVTNDRKILLNGSPPISGHRPSIDFLMESVASVYKNQCIGLILTGMGRDGAKGMKAIRKSGGFTMSQNEESCAIFGMPKAAIENGAAMKTCSVEQIPDEIIRWSMENKAGSKQLGN